MKYLGAFHKSNFGTEKQTITIDTQIVPSEDYMLSSVLQHVIDGNVPDYFPKNCIYDWKYKNKPTQYHGCAVVEGMGGSKARGKLVCPTRLNDKGSWINFKGPRTYEICRREVTLRAIRLYYLNKDVQNFLCK